MRTGIRIVGARSNSEVRECLIRYAKWLRKKYEFPIRIPVYLFPSETIITSDGEHVVASFFAPWSRDIEPFIRIATGGYSAVRSTRTRDDALAAYIVSLSHELLRYFQWVESGEVHEKGVACEARKMLDRYSQHVDHP